MSQAHHPDYTTFLAQLDKVNRAIQGTNDLQQMMQDVLDVLLSVFDCDRAFLLYSCAPHASSWRIPMERTRPQYPSAGVINLEVPMEADVAQTLRVLLEAEGAVTFDSASPNKTPSTGVYQAFSIRSFIGMALRPKLGEPWQLGLHQCSDARVWTTRERELFEVIGQRVADALSVFLSFQELSESRAFLDNVFEHVPEMLFVKSASDLHFVRINRAGEEILGYTERELLGRGDHDFFAPEEAAFFTAVDRQVLASGELVDVAEETIQTKKGTRLLHTKKIPLFDKHGRPAYLLGVSQDITERRAMERRVLASEREFRTLAENSPDNIVRYDAQCRRTYVNPTLQRTLKQDSHALTGQTPRELPSIVGMADYKRLLERVLETGDTAEMDLILYDDLKGVRFQNVRFVAERGDDGEITGAQAVGRDVTDRMLHEQELRKLHHVIQQCPVSIVIAATDGTIEFVNDHFCAVTGYTASEAIGSKPSLLKSGKQHPQVYDELWETIVGGGVWRGEMLNRKKSGELFREAATIAPVRNAAGIITNYVAVKEDVTERRRLEELLVQSRRMELIGQLAGGIAHDFNNMLGAIIGGAELALDNGALDDFTKECLQDILSAGYRSADITTQLLSFARSQNADRRPLAVDKTLQGMLKVLQRVVGEAVEIV